MLLDPSDEDGLPDGESPRSPSTVDEGLDNDESEDDDEDDDNNDVSVEEEEVEEEEEPESMKELRPEAGPDRTRTAASSPCRLEREFSDAGAGLDLDGEAATGTSLASVSSEAVGLSTQYDPLGWPVNSSGPVRGPPRWCRCDDGDVDCGYGDFDGLWQWRCHCGPTPGVTRPATSSLPASTSSGGEPWPDTYKERDLYGRWRRRASEILEQDVLDPELLEGRAAAAQGARGRQNDEAAPGGDSYVHVLTRSGLELPPIIQLRRIGRYLGVRHANDTSYRRKPLPPSLTSPPLSLPSSPPPSLSPSHISSTSITTTPLTALPPPTSPPSPLSLPSTPPECRCPLDGAAEWTWCPACDLPIVCNDVLWLPHGRWQYAQGPFRGQICNNTGEVDQLGWPCQIFQRMQRIAHPRARRGHHGRCPRSSTRPH